MSRFGKHFIIRNSGLIEFRTPNSKKGFFLQMIAAFGVFCALLDIPYVLTGNFILRIFYGDYYLAVFAWFFHSLAAGSVIMWLITNPSKVLFDRLKKEVVLEAGKESLRFPWSSIRFESRWIPTKIGGVQLLSIKAVPPFPEGLKLNHKISGKVANNSFVPLGSVNFPDGEEARAFIGKLSELMETSRSIPEIFGGRT